MKKSFLFFGCLFFLAVSECYSDSFYQTKIVCFISASNPQFSYAHVGSTLCTHYILIDLAVVNRQGSLSLVEQSIPALTSFLEFKDRLSKTDDSTRFMLSIGGSNQESRDFSKAIRSKAGLAELVEDIVDFVERHELDGVDITWLNPGEAGDCKADRINLVRLFNELRGRMAPESSLSLTASLNPEVFDLRSIDIYVDFVNLLTVDYHEHKKPSHVAPLYSKDSDDPSSVFRSVRAFVMAGLNPQKIVVLTSTHGYLYTLQFCFAEGRIIVKSVEKLNKYRVQSVLEQNNFHISWDDTRQVPYGTLAAGTFEKKWITFSDLESHRLKAKFVLKYQLGGIGAYTIDQEETRAHTTGCQPGIPFPFLWVLVDTIRPSIEYRHPPLLIDEDINVQYFPRQQTASLVNTNEYAFKSEVDVPYRYFGQMIDE